MRTSTLALLLSTAYAVKMISYGDDGTCTYSPEGEPIDLTDYCDDPCDMTTCNLYDYYAVLCELPEYVEHFGDDGSCYEMYKSVLD